MHGGRPGLVVTHHHHGLVGKSEGGEMWNQWSLGKIRCDFKNSVNLVLLTGIFRSACDGALRRMLQGLIDDKINIGSGSGLFGASRPQWVFKKILGLTPLVPLVHTILGNKLQWNLSRGSNIFVEENYTPEKAVCWMAVILTRPHCVKSYDMLGRRALF